MERTSNQKLVDNSNIARGANSSIDVIELYSVCIQEKQTIGAQTATCVYQSVALAITDN